MAETILEVKNLYKLFKSNELADGEELAFQMLEEGSDAAAVRERTGIFAASKRTKKMHPH